MTFRSIAAVIAAVFASQASAQVYYLPIEIPMPPEVSLDLLGKSLAVGDGNIYIGGAGRSDSYNQTPSGVYQFDLDTFDYIQTYHGTNFPYDDSFGWSTKYHDGVLLVGAPGAEEDSGPFGAAYLINPINGSILHTFDEPPVGSFDSGFGIEVALNDVVINIGATRYSSGRVFVYLASNNALLTTLAPDPATADRRYGAEIAQNDDYFVVSAPGITQLEIPGAVYVYDFLSGDLLHRITPPGQAPNDWMQFGANLDLEGSTLIVGFDSVHADTPAQQKAYVYDLTNGNLTNVLEPVNSNAGDRFGFDVSLENNIAVVSATGDKEGSGFLGNNTGAVYIFNLATDELIDKVIIPNNPLDYFGFGRDVVIQDGTILASAFNEDSPIFLDHQSVFLLRQFCRQDLNFDGSINFFDLSTLLKFAIDWDDNGTFNFFDIAGYITAFSEPCNAG